MIARAAAPMATSEPIPTTGVARAAPAVSTAVVVGSPGRPEDEGTMRVVVVVLEDSPVGTSVVGIGRPEGGRITLVVVATGGPLSRVEETADIAGVEEAADGAGTGSYDGLPGSGTHWVTVTVTVAAGAQTAVRDVSLCARYHVEVSKQLCS